ncbi:MAG: archease [Nanoarchaeota archaeon]|nr:archease [Nanoarchaeota archaeon]
MKFKFLSHTADVKFRAYSDTLEGAFSNSVLAVSKFLFDGKIKEEKKFSVKISGRDFESLLYNFIEEILFLIDSKNFVPSKVANLKIDKKKFSLSATFLGGPAQDYKIESHIKAVTYNEMFVKKIKNKWVLQVVLDI